MNNSKNQPYYSAVFVAALLLLSGLVFLLSWHGLIYGAGSDPRYTLIVSQSILENGTIALDAYADDEIWGEPANFAENFNIIERNGRTYNYFPAGPSVLSVPSVAVARLAGWDMRLAADNIYAQRLLSSLSLVALLWLMAGIARCFLPWRSAWVVTAVSLLGSTLISTMGTALWSINFSVLAIAAALLLLVRRETGLSESIHPVWLGLLLFLAYFSRAAAAAFIVPLFVYLAYSLRQSGKWFDFAHLKPAKSLIFSSRGRELVGTAVTAAMLLLLFLLWSKWEFGSWLPIYYSTARLGVDRGPVWVAVLGVLFSSGRGLFVYTPTAVLLLLVGPGLWRQPLAWLCAGWIGLHLLVLLRGTIWWGGDTFGPRILTELMLALFLLSLLAWQQIRQERASVRQRFAFAYLVLGLIGIWLHSYQGLYNYSTALWNAVASHQPVPPYTSALGDLFSWQYPQFAASSASLCQLTAQRTRQIVAEAAVLRPYIFGEPIRYGPETAVSLRSIPQANSSPAALIGWAPIDNDRARDRELFCEEAAVLFQLGDVPPGAYELQLTSAAFGRQRVQIWLNDVLVGETIFVQQPGLVVETAVLPLNATHFLPNQLNELNLVLPDAYPFSYKDPSRMSLAIEAIVFLSEQ
ncbi:MAG: hypothetical protein IPM53_10035 [Anaerolineaceae bacterium]|nr:hypothetical protein [Anaerolineaceae bacterium]